MVQPGSNKKAMAWTIFHTFCEVANPELQGWAACNLCGEKYKYANGTRGLWQHLQNNHKETWKLLHSHSSNIIICPQDEKTTSSISTNTPSKHGMIQLDILSFGLSTSQGKEDSKIFVILRKARPPGYRNSKMYCTNDAALECSRESILPADD